MNRKLYPVAIGLVAGLFSSTGAVAASQYDADRAFCNSSKNQEGRALCLKEAAAAQRELRHGGSTARTKADQSATEPDSTSGTTQKGLGEKAHEGAQKTRNFTHRQLQKTRDFGARHNPGGTVEEPNKAPSALGK